MVIEMGTLYSNEIVGRCTSFYCIVSFFNWCLEWGQLKSWSVNFHAFTAPKCFPSLSIYQASIEAPPPLPYNWWLYIWQFLQTTHFHSHLQTDNQNVITVSTLGSHRSKWATRRHRRLNKKLKQRGREWQRGEIRTGERGTDGGPVEWRLRLDSSLRYPDLIRWPITVTLANHLMSMSFTTGSATQSLTFPFSPYYRHQSKAVFY